MSPSPSFIPLLIDVPRLAQHTVDFTLWTSLFDANQIQVLHFHALGILVRDSGVRGFAAPHGPWSVQIVFLW
jgi:hypothetical protein